MREPRKLTAAVSHRLADVDHLGQRRGNQSEPEEFEEPVVIGGEPLVEAGHIRRVVGEPEGGAEHREGIGAIPPRHNERLLEPDSHTDDGDAGQRKHPDGVRVDYLQHGLRVIHTRTLPNPADDIQDF